MTDHAIPEPARDEKAAAEALLGFINPTTDPAEVARRKIAWDAFEQGRQFERRATPDSPLDAARLAQALERVGCGDATGDLDLYQEWGGTPNEIATNVILALRDLELEGNVR